MAQERISNWYTQQWAIWYLKSSCIAWKTWRSWEALRCCTCGNSETSPSLCVSVAPPSFLCTPVLGNTNQPAWWIKNSSAEMYGLMLAPDWLPYVWLGLDSVSMKITLYFLYSCIPRPVLHVKLYFLFSQTHPLPRYMGVYFFMKLQWVLLNWGLHILLFWAFLTYCT